MKILVIDKPLQDENTISPQLIDGEVVHWCVRSECLKVNETFQEWLIRKEERINTHPNYSSVEGLLIYDMQPIVSIPYEGKSHGSMIIRYAFLRKKEENI
jgi:hypothetical protein